MADIPEEDNAALQKRKAIQAVMRDQSLSPVERNQRMQDIMKGNYHVQSMPKAPPAPMPTASANTATTTTTAPPRNMGKRDSSAKALIEKLNKPKENTANPEYLHSATFGSINSAGRGKGLQENIKSGGVGVDDNKKALSPEEKQKRAFIPSGLFSDNKKILEDRVHANSPDKNKSGSDDKGTTTTMDEFEQRILAKSQRLKPAAETETKRSSGSKNSVDEMEQRILKKTTSHDSIDSSRGTSNSHGSKLEQRILEKNKSINSAVAAANPHPETSRKPRPSFEQRLLDKNKKSNSSTITGHESSPLLDSFASMGSSTSTSFEDRLHSKLSSRAVNLNESNTSNSNNNNQDSSISSFEDRLNSKLSSRAVNLNESNTPNNNLDSSMASFDERLRDKTIRAASMKNTPAAPSGAAAATTAVAADPTPSQGESGGGEEVSDAGVSGAAKKRAAIKAVMENKSLSPQERNQQLTAIMSGNWTDDDANNKDKDKGQRKRGKKKDKAMKSLRTAALEAKIAAKFLKKTDEEGSEDDGSKGSQDQDMDGDENHSNDDDVSDIEESRRTSLMVDEHGNLVMDSSSPSDDDDDPGVGYGSLPLPEEHFDPTTTANTQEYPTLEELERQQDHYPALEELEQQQDGEISGPVGDSDDDVDVDVNLGLAVATAIAPDEEPDYVYNAIEYDPDAKPPLHRNRRFRVYTYFALGLIAIMVALVVVWITSQSKRNEITKQTIQYQNSPSMSPTGSPITARESMGIIEQLEAGVLYVRNETFVSMVNLETGGREDPRLLALEWILHKDGLQLLSDEVNLYQRFALAVLAYTMDSPAWYHCGDPGENYTEAECPIYFASINATEPFNTWLSSTSECTWYGVTCSEDGVVRGVALVNNDLIGTLPYELHAIKFLQELAIPHNCIHGTIPPELGMLRNLLSLELHGNGLHGQMPPEIYDLEKLQLLNLAEQYGQGRKCNKTDGTIVDIDYKMGGLTWPLEENAGLTGVLDKRIGVWRSMKGLYLNKNSFEGEIAEEIGGLRYLRFLWLNDNFIAGSLPTTITKLRNLRHLKLADNFLKSSLPSDLGRLTDIEILTVNGNSMFGPIPNGLYKLKKLEILRLDDTLMSEAPWLIDPDEGFTGSLDPLIGGMQDLRWLLLSNNPLSGTIPTEIGLCEKLQVFRVHRTNINGTMPQEICMLRDKSLNNEQGTGVLYSDCRPNNRTGDPFLKCDCCSDCCDHTTGVCIQDD